MAVLASLGEFVFTPSSALYNELKRGDAFNYKAVESVHGSPNYHFTGPGEKSLTATGTLFPAVTGGEEQLDKLREMAASGKAWLFVCGDEGDSQFRSLGRWVIVDVTAESSFFDAAGKARKIDFTLELKRVSGDG